MTLLRWLNLSSVTATVLGWPRDEATSDPAPGSTAGRELHQGSGCSWNCPTSLQMVQAGMDHVGTCRAG